MRIFFTVIFFLLSSMAFAEDLNFDFRKQMLHTGHKVDGYELATSLELPVSFSHSRSQLGISSGNYIDVGGKFRSALHYRHGLHDWSTAVFLGEVFDMSPAIPNRWVKNLDLLRLESRYLYNLLPKLAFFAHARAETSIFSSIDLNDKDKNYEMRNIDNTLREKITRSEVHLNDPFMPLFFQENFGVVSGLVQEKALTLEARAAASFRQTIAGGQRVFVEELDDETRVVRDLQSFYQIGPVVGAAMKGLLFNDKVEYSAGIDVMWPAWQSPRSDRTFVDSLIVEASAGAGFHFSDWGTLQYQYITTRIPDILPKFQQLHSVVLNLRFDWLYRFGQLKEVAMTDQNS